MTTSELRGYASTVLFMLAVTFVSMSLVSGVHLATRATVARNRTLFLKQAVAEVAGAPDMDAAALSAWYEANVTEVPERGDAPRHFRVQPTEAGGAPSLVVLGKGPGLWGTIVALIGFVGDTAAVKAIAFLEHNETPGLGARIDEPWFRRQFAGRTGPFTRLAAERQDKTDMSGPDGTFDQITGATITSSAVRDILNHGTEQARELATAP